MFPSTLTFDLDLILGSFFTFWNSNGLFLGLGKGSKTVLGSTHVVEQHSFYMFPLNLSFFLLNVGAIFTFWGPNGLFLGLGYSSKTVLGSTHAVVQLSFCMFPSILVLGFT